MNWMWGVASWALGGMDAPVSKYKPTFTLVFRSGAASRRIKIFTASGGPLTKSLRGGPKFVVTPLTVGLRVLKYCWIKILKTERDVVAELVDLERRTCYSLRNSLLDQRLLLNYWHQPASCQFSLSFSTGGTYGDVAVMPSGVSKWSASSGNRLRRSPVWEHRPPAVAATEAAVTYRIWSEFLLNADESIVFLLFFPLVVCGDHWSKMYSLSV